MPDLLFEIGTEELPSASVLPLSNALASELSKLLEKNGIKYGETRVFATPRRLAVLVQSVEEKQIPQKISRRGPAYTAQGAESAAVKGFAQSCGVSTDALSLQETPKGKWWFYESDGVAGLTQDILPSLVVETVKLLPIPKPMRWGEGADEFVRPVHWLVLLFGNKVIDCSIFGVKAGNVTYGHRFLAPQSIVLSSPHEYESVLQEAFVIVDFAIRKQLITEQVSYLATSVGGIAILLQALLDEVTSIVEWPLALLAHFDESFLLVPKEALIASMQGHQKCFAIRAENGGLMPYFVTVSNIKSRDPHSVIHGNEKVMRARLSDAAFFYHQDLRVPLSAYREGTRHVVFQEKLGTLFDKSERLCQMISFVAPLLKLDHDEATKAAELSKCCLMTGMVNEFPELQGVMGQYYAKAEGRSNAIALALYEQYLPRGGSDNLPGSTLGTALSLVDRLDTLVGTFSIGLRPTGVKDPFKLRRHALAVARILLQTPKAPPLRTLLEHSLKTYRDTVKGEADVLQSLHRFIVERVYAFYETQGIPAHFIDAIRAKQDDDFYDLGKRLLALKDFSEREEASSLSAACKRVHNILQQQSKEHAEVDVSLLQDDDEKQLYERLQAVSKEVLPYYAEQKYDIILMLLAGVRDAVDAFFENVMVMVDEPRIKRNRLLLLMQLQQLLQGVADISLLA